MLNVCFKLLAASISISKVSPKPLACFVLNYCYYSVGFKAWAAHDPSHGKRGLEWKRHIFIIITYPYTTERGFEAAWVPQEVVLLLVVGCRGNLAVELLVVLVLSTNNNNWTADRQQQQFLLWHPSSSWKKEASSCATIFIITTSTGIEKRGTLEMWYWHP